MTDEKKMNIYKGVFWGACIGLIYATQAVTAIPYNNDGKLLKPIVAIAWVSAGILVSASMGGLAGAYCLFFVDKKDNQCAADDLERAVQSFIRKNCNTP